MSRSAVIAVVALILVAGALVFLSTRASERPTTRVEKVVTLENLQN